MCGSMVYIQSATAEIRRGNKKRRRKIEDTTEQKYNVRICYAGRPYKDVTENSDTLSTKVTNIKVSRKSSTRSTSDSKSHTVETYRIYSTRLLLIRIEIIMVALCNRADHYIFILWFLMAALRSRCGHYIFALWYLLSFFFFFYYLA